MGKSPNSCFKIISCGADSTDIDDDLSTSEGKQSSDKRRWSFRKRSARDQVLSSTVISEPQVVGFDKENSEASTAKFYSVKDSSVREKPPAREQANALAPLASAVVNLENNHYVEQPNETAPLSSAVVNSDSPPVTEQVNKTDPFTSATVNLEEKVASDTDEVTAAFEEDLQSTVVVIQAAARRFLAQKELQKLKNVVKLQAAVRGHLVRKQAIGTLRCVQAITKLQILVRARRARQCQLREKCAGQEMNNEEFQTDLVKKISLKPTQINSTLQKLLSNGFARQLLESAPKSKPVHISCDALRYDSAWQWLERWMAVTSSKVWQQEELVGSLGHQEEIENSNASHEELDVNPVLGAPTLSGPRSPRNLTAAASEGDSKTDNFGNFESQAPATVSDQCFNSLAEREKEHSQGEEVIVTNNENFSQTVTGKENPDTGLRFAHSNYPNYTDSDRENLMCAAKTSASGPLETEGKKFDLGSRKIRNPAFAAVQAKFEELSSAPKASRFVSISRDAALESKAIHSQVVSVARKDLSSIENLTTKNPTIQVAPSECGTEISISSTLDSPDRSEIDGGEIVLEIETSLEVTHNVDGGATEAFNLDNMKAEAKILSATSVKFKGQKPNEDDENMANSVAAFDPVSMEQPPVETITPGNWNQQENLKSPAYNSSPEGSPRNHATAPESHGTPSSQVSVQSKASKLENEYHPVRKPKSKSGTKSLSSNGKNDSDERSSTEHLPKEAKNANRRSSFGTAKPDLTDNDSRRSSSNSVPSYMQATESARAKAHGSVSLKSSPDVHDKESHMKKRHSLPIADEKQGSSPRVQMLASQTQQSSKRNNNHSPHSSAERRWQR